MYNNYIKLIAIFTSIYHLYTGFFGIPYSMIHRPIHLMLVFLVYFLYKNKNITNKLGKLYNYIFILLTILSTSYLVFSSKYLLYRIEYVTPLTKPQYILGITLIVIILIVVYRVIGASLCIVTIIFLLYSFFGKYLPSPFWHRGYSLSRTIDGLYLSFDGIWGIALYVSSTFIYLFILFGTILKATGAGDYFNKIACIVSHGLIGGTAKTAIVASSLMGTISGSSSANVVTTGSFTIPSMKKSGYSSIFAGAVEAVASTGGQLVPPVMGSAAFIMAEFTGIPYVQIMKHAIIPAFLYYSGVYMMVHIESLRLFGNKKIISNREKKDNKNINFLLFKSYLIIPIFTLIYFLIRGYSPIKSSIYTISTLFFLALLFDRNKIDLLKKILNALEEGAKIVIPIAAACASAGIIVGIISMTGLGQRITSIILYMAGGNLLLILLLTMLMAIILGMGMPTPSAYIIMAALLAPSLVMIGVSTIAAHLYIFYFACISAITPPVALAAYAAAAIANAPASKTGYKAFYLGIASYLVPFMFVYENSLLMIGNIFSILYNFFFAFIAIFSISIFIQGWFYVKFNATERVFSFFITILLIIQNFSVKITGVIFLILFLSYIYKKFNRDSYTAPI